MSSDLLYGIGLVLGVALALLSGQLFLFFAAPLAEWVLERCLRESTPPEAPPDWEAAGAVFVTDLHVDTWELDGYTDKSPVFARFVQKLQGLPTLSRLYFGGDFADIPLHPNFFPQPPLLELGKDFPQNPVYSVLMGTQHPRRELERLLAQKQVAGILGNHELGITGIRYADGRVALWNPALRISGDTKGTFSQQLYIEHGHRFDPLLWLYLRYAVRDLLRRGYGETEPPHPPLTERKLRDRLESTALGRNAHLPAQSSQSKTLGEWLVVLRYRWYARWTLKAIRREYPQVTTFLCGHTHVPDRWRFSGGTAYVNGGDWCGNTPHHTFCLVDAKGEVHGPFEFEEGIP